MSGAINKAEAVVANNGQTSSAVPLGPATLIAVNCPAALTSTAMTFTQSSDRGATYTTVKDVGGGAYSITVAAGNYVPVDPRVFCGVRLLKCVCGTAEGAERTIELMTKELS